MAYPSTLASLTDPQSTDKLNAPSHSAIEQAQNAGIKEIQAFVGTLSSTVGTLVYDIRAVASNGGGHIQSANKGGTGQTAYAKGDVLVAQSSSVISKLGVGLNDQVIIADSNQATGIKWGNVPGVNVQSFLATGTWNKPSIAATGRVFVELWGGGASGGSRNTTGVAGGGGGGCYASGWFNASTLGLTELVIVGPSVVGVSGDTTGNAGNVTVFGTTSSFLTAFGGGAGTTDGATAGGGGGGGPLAVGAAGSGGTGGAAGSPGTPLAGTGGASGAVGGNGFYSAGGGGSNAVGGNTIYGGGGGGGVSSAGAGAAGGTSMYGGAGGKGSIAGIGGAGVQPSGGGGGATNTTAGHISGTGAPGKVIITTFAS